MLQQLHLPLRLPEAMLLFLHVVLSFVAVPCFYDSRDGAAHLGHVVLRLCMLGHHVTTQIQKQFATSGIARGGHMMAYGPS